MDVVNDEGLCGAWKSTSDGGFLDAEIEWQGEEGVVLLGVGGILLDKGGLVTDGECTKTAAE